MVKPVENYLYFALTGTAGDAARDAVCYPASTFIQATYASATTTTLNNSTTTMDMDSSGDILFVTRLSADSGGYQVSCREVPSAYGGLTTDSSSLYYASVTDPVYWIDANTSGSDGNSATLYVKPTPESTQVAYVHHVKYPIFTAGDTETYDISSKTIIANFPDEAEHLVVLRAAVSASEYLLAIEEDVELYGAVLTTLKAQYQAGVQALISGGLVPQQPQQQRG